LWKDDWVEPVTPPPFPVHVIAQQTLCRVLERGAVPYTELASFGRDYDGLLDHLVSRGMLHIDGGLVSIGPEAERLWGGRNYMELLSVFDTPELFTVMFGPHELGVLHELSFRRDDAVVLLAGRPWRVTSLNRDRRVAHVEPAADEHGRSTWLGSSQGLSFEICQAMRQILLNPTATLSRRAIDELAQLAAQGTADPDGTVLRATRTGCDWWTYAGLKGNAALVHKHALPATFDSMTIHIGCSAIELRARLDTHASVSPPERDPHFRPKFAECVPENLLALLGWNRLYDWQAADRVRGMETVYEA
jgi:ATP-dependent Lhr-like helicase